MASPTAVVLIFAVLLCGVIECITYRDQCIDLDGLAGRCVKLSKCHSMGDIWRTPVKSIRQSERLADSLCGRYSKNPLVCCTEGRTSQIDVNAINYGKPSYFTTTMKTPAIGSSRRTSSSWRRLPTTASTTAKAKATTTKTFRTTSKTTRFTTPKVEPQADETGFQQTTLTEFPWSALIQYRKLYGVYGFHCGGTLIHERYVVTAAHCVKAIPRTWEISLVRLGEFDIKSPDVDCDKVQCGTPPLDIFVEQIIVHEGYVTRLLSQYHDIALIRLMNAVQPTAFVRPIQLPLPEMGRSLFNTLKTGISAGWGRSKTGSASTVKLKVQLELEDLNGCSESYKVSGVKLTDGQLCASEWRGTGTCSCDSGGALMVRMNDRYYLIGIVSFGPTKCGLKNVPGVYTSVIKYTSWIRRNIY
ncbi:CLIP domain-containing serine protease B4-like isoform X2 [Armigeres subalbatus]